MENLNKKYSITLDRSVYESNDLNELEKLAIDALDVKDWMFLISELTKIKFEDTSYGNDECDSIANEENDILIFLPNDDIKTFQIKKLSSYGMDDDTTKDIDNIVELVKEINNLKK